MENLNCLFCNFPWDIFFFMLALGLLLWWLLSWLLGRKYKSQIEELEYNYAALEKEHGKLKRECDDRTAYLENELEACRKSKVNVGGGGTAAAAVGAVAAQSPAPKAKKSNKKDDLKIVEGIGPKIEELFNNAGIYTFAELASTPVERLKEVLVDGGTRFQMHDPGTWPEQAAMARDGKWDELKKWQDELDKGREA